MADTDTLRPYRRQDAPAIPGAEKRYLDAQLAAIQTLLNQLINVTKKLEARIEDLETS